MKSLLCFGYSASLLLAGVSSAYVQDAFAQSRSFDCTGSSLSAAEGREILSQAQKNYSKISTLKASFAQESYLAALSISETSEGEMQFQKPGNMRWDYVNPDPQTFLVNDHTVWLYQPNDKQLIIDKFDTILLTDLPVAFLMGIGDLNKDFEIKDGCKNKEGDILHLLPKKKNAAEELTGFYLLIQPDSFEIKGGKVIDASGNVTSITLKNIRFNSEIFPTAFKPKFPDGIDVTDRRKELHE